MTGCKVNLLAIGISFSCKICKEVIGIIRIFDFFCCCFYLNLNLFYSFFSFIGKCCCHFDRCVFFRSCNSTCRCCVVTDIVMCSHIYDFRMIRCPCNFDTIFFCWKCDISTYIIFVRDIYTCKCFVHSRFNVLTRNFQTDACSLIAISDFKAYIYIIILNGYFSI